MRALRRRQFIAEDIEPTADELMVDVVLVHPRAALVEIGELRRDRPCRLAARVWSKFTFGKALASNRS
jgi:hypothetical protein